MGFRTVMITADTGLDIPEWFMDKWGKQFHFGVSKLDDNGVQVLNAMPVSSKFERKFYASKDEEVFADLQKVLNERLERGEQWLKEFEIVLFHECDGITKVHILPKEIRMYEPVEWHEVDEITHNYCYGCSTPQRESESATSRPTKTTHSRKEETND